MTEDSNATLIKTASKMAYWKAATVVFIVLFAVSIATQGFNFGNGSTGMFVKKPVDSSDIKSVDSQEAATKTIKFLNDNIVQGTNKLSFVSAEKKDSLYEVTAKYNGQDTKFHTTIDGKYVILEGYGMIDMESFVKPTPAAQQPPASIPKSDKPKVELFVMSYCPYGTQVEKGILPVVDLLKDKIDFQVKFVYYVMHGEKEIKEQLQQHCIETGQPDKYINYLKCFLEAGDSEKCLVTANIDKAKLAECAASADKQFNVTQKFNDKKTWLSGNYPLFDVYKADNEKYGVGGSPTLIVNGVDASSGRDPASLLKTVCSAFTTAPGECSTQLSSAEPVPGFGTGTSGSATSGSCG